jgi:hypothetical protein
MYPFVPAWEFGHSEPKRKTRVEGREGKKITKKRRQREEEEGEK